MLLSALLEHLVKTLQKQHDLLFEEDSTKNTEASSQMAGDIETVALLVEFADGIECPDGGLSFHAVFQAAWESDIACGEIPWAFQYGTVANALCFILDGRSTEDLRNGLSALDMIGRRISERLRTDETLSPPRGIAHELTVTMWINPLLLHFDRPRIRVPGD